MDRISILPTLQVGTTMWARDLSGSRPPAGFSTKQVFREPLEVKEMQTVILSSRVYPCNLLLPRTKLVISAFAYHLNLRGKHWSHTLYYIVYESKHTGYLLYSLLSLAIPLSGRRNSKYCINWSSRQTIHLYNRTNHRKYYVPV
jgi:hypothetical protein